MQPNDSCPDSWPELFRLLANISEQCARAVACLDRVLPVLVATIASLQRAVPKRPENRAQCFVATLVDKLTDAVAKLEECRREIKIAVRIVTRMRKTAEARWGPAPTDAPGAEADSGGPEIRSLRLDHVIDGPKRKADKHVFVLEGRPEELPRAVGVTLLELMQDDSTSSDRWVPWKTRAQLADALQVHERAFTKRGRKVPDVTKKVVSSRVRQLKHYLKTYVGAPDGLIETENGRGYRLRLVRPEEEEEAGPPAEDAGNPPQPPSQT